MSSGHEVRSARNGPIAAARLTCYSYFDGAMCYDLFALVSVTRYMNNEDMIYPGRVQNGVVVLESGQVLPEGASVSIWCPTIAKLHPSPKGQRVQVPLVRSERPGCVELTGDRIAAILDEEDAPSRH